MQCLVLRHGARAWYFRKLTIQMNDFIANLLSSKI